MVDSFSWRAPLGCATAEDAQILDERIYQLQTQLKTIQKEKDSLKKDLAVFQKEVESDISKLKNEQASFQKEVQMNVSTLQKNDQLLRTDLTEETKRIQTELLLQSEIGQSKLNTTQKEIEILKRNLSVLQKEVESDISAIKKEQESFQKEAKLNVSTLEKRDQPLEDRPCHRDQKASG